MPKAANVPSQLLSGLHPAAIQEEVGFKIDLTRAVEEEPPTEHELNTSRTQCDPDKMVLKS